MTLRLLSNGSQLYRFILIEDTVDVQAYLLLRAFVSEGLAYGKEVHMFCFDNPPEVIQSNLNVQKNKNLHFHDFFTDCAGWLSEQSYQKIEVKFPSIQKSSPDCSGLLFVIDSLSNIIISDGFNRIYRQIYQLINHDIGKGDCSRQLVGVIYPETLLHYEAISVQLKHLTTNWITLTNKKGNQLGSIIVNVENKKANGKLLKQVEECWLDSQFTLQSQKIEVTKETVNKSNSSEIPSELTTFKLGLNEEEKVARSQLVLPYLKNENLGGGIGEGGSIFYEPDENDDWDEEDPDDDLDV